MRATEEFHLPETLEQALARLEVDAAALQRAALQVLNAAKKLAAAAKTGDLNGIERSLADAARLSELLNEQRQHTTEAWDFDVSGHVESGAYQSELFAAAAEAGLSLHEQDGRIFSYPVLVRILKGSDIGAITVDRKKLRILRPSALVAQLRNLRDRPPKANSKLFLQSLYDAYQLAESARRGSGTSARGPVIELLELYEILTLFPGQKREYSRQEFTRDIYLLDRSGATEAEGAVMELSASSGTRTNRFLRIVDEYANEHAYYGISFARRSLH